MMNLLISILLNSYLGISFTYFKRHHVDLFQAIVFNYWACVITGSVMLGYFPIQVSTISEPWFKWAILMGALFISVFNLIAFSSIKVGVTTTQTANKLSLVIPVIFSYFLYYDDISVVKIIGIIAALGAVILVSIKKSKNPELKIQPIDYLLPVVLFVSSGIIDTLTKFVQNTFLVDDMTSNSYLISGFFIAAFIGSFVLLFLYFTKKKTFAIKNLVAGILLGVPNYFSIYFLVKALENKSLSSSATIPINNIGVLFLVGIFGIFIFNEKMSRLNYIGLALTLISIFLIFLVI